MQFSKEINWYAIMTKCANEDRVEFHLSRLGLEVFNPKQRKKRKMGNSKSLTKPLFPGYLFAKFSPSNYLHTIQYTRGVLQVLHFGASLLHVDEEIIVNIRERLDKEGCVDLTKPMLEGDPVEICEGTFGGLRGLFKREMSDRKRVVVLIDLLGDYARVVMEKNLIETRP